jgi:hypothetical protein
VRIEREATGIAADHERREVVGDVIEEGELARR